MRSVLPDDLLNEAIPGNIRKAEHFVAFLKRFVEYLKVLFPIRGHYVSRGIMPLLYRRGCVYCMLWRKRLCPFYSILKTLLISSGGHYGKQDTTLIFTPTPIFYHQRFCADRLQSLVRTLEVSRLDEYSALQKVASFATLVSTYEKGRLVSPVSCHPTPSFLFRVSSHS